MARNVLVAGATGLIGKELVAQLINSQEYESIHIITRRPYNLQHPKLASYVIDFDNFSGFKTQSIIHDVYVCLGTTMKKAGSKEAFKRVDYDYVISVAKWAKGNNVERFSVISSVGAERQKGFGFYLSVKAQTEKSLQEIGFKNLVILRPSFLMGKREEYRLNEKISSAILKPILPLMIGKLKHFKPVEARQVAAAMIYYTLNSSSSLRIVENEEILCIR